MVYRTILIMVVSMMAAIVAAWAVKKFKDSYVDAKEQNCEEGTMETKMEHEQKNQKMLWVVFLLLGAAGGFLFSRYQYSMVRMLRYFIVMYTVIAVAEIDKRLYMIPNKAVLFLFAVQVPLLIADCICEPGEWLSFVSSSLLGLLIGGVTFLVGYLIGRHSMGLGDVKLLASMGFCLGDHTVVPIILLSLLLSAIYGITQLVRKKMKAKDSMPYAPFVAYATIPLLLLGF